MRILITPPLAPSKACLECLVTWSRAGLLDPFCWWEANSQTGQGGLEVVVVDRGREEQMLLADALRESSPDEVALVAFVPLDSTVSVDGSFSDAVDRKVAVARQVLAYRQESPVESAIVVAPSAIGMPVDPALFSAERSANVYVAPEDRDDPKGVNALAENEARLAPHASHAIATIAEIWRSAGRGGQSVLDILKERQPAVAPAPVQVVRCFTRGIDIGYLADHVAESVFLPGNAWPNPDPERFDRIRDSEALVDRAARAFMRKHQATLGPSKFEPYVIPPDEEVGLWEALKRLVRIIIDRIKRKPIEIVVEGVGRVHDWTADKVEKIDGGATGIKIPRWGQKRQSGDEFVELDDALEMPPVVREGPVGPTWSDLTGLALCLVDGRAWPEGLGEDLSDRGRKRILVTDPFLIGPDPERGYDHARGDRSRPVCDPMTDDPSMKKESSVSKPHRVMGTKSSGNQKDSKDEGGDQEGELILEAARGTAAEESEPGQGRARSSLLWKVGLYIAKAQKQVESEAASLRAKEEAELDPESEEAKERERERHEEIQEKSKLRVRGLLKTMILSSFAVIIAALLAFNLPLFARIPVLIVLPTLWLLAMILKVRKMLIEERREAREILQANVDRYNRRLKAHLREGDAIRIDRRYAEFMEWAEIIGWFVHTPWIGEPLEKIEVDAPVPPGSRPLAFQMGTGVSDHDWLARIGRVSQSHVFQPGWLNELYSKNRSEVLNESSDASFGSSEHSDAYQADPADDTSDDPDSPRRRLLLGVRRGDFRHIGDNVMTQDLLNRLDSLRIDKAADRVEDDVTGAERVEALPVSPSWFSPPSNLDSLMRRITPSVLRVTARDGGLDSVGTGALLPGNDTIITALHVVEGGASITVADPEGREIEAVIEKAVPEYDLAVLRLSESIDSRAVSFGEPDDLEIGGPIVTLGYRGSTASSPALSWGIVTDLARSVDLTGLGEEIEMVEANYRSAQGSSGAPVFDLAGKAVGLHVGSRRSGGGEARLTYMSHAIPVDILRQVVDGSISGASADGWEPPRTGLVAVEIGGRRRALKGMRPSEFLADLIDSENDQAFLPGHWFVGSEAPPNEVDLVVSEPEVANVGDSVVAQYCEGTAFFRSLRLIVHRTDIAEPTTQDALASLVNGKGGGATS